MQGCLNVIEKWKVSVNKDGVFGALMTDLSRAFDCLRHELSTHHQSCRHTETS